MTAAGVRGTAARGTRSRWLPPRSVLAWLPFVLFLLPLLWQSQLEDHL